MSSRGGPTESLRRSQRLGAVRLNRSLSLPAAQALAQDILDREPLLAGPSGRHVHCAGLRLWVVDEGERSGPVILLIHGLGVHGGIWTHVVPMLVAQGFRVIVPDLPGHGRSDARRRASYSPRFHARALLALLDALDVRSVTPVGNSLGGLVAARLALARPNSVERLVLVDAAGLSHQGIPWKTRLAYLPAVLPTLLGTAPSRVWTRLFLSQMVVFDPVHVPSLVALMEAHLPSITALRRTAASLMGPEGAVASELHHITAPTLLVWGQEDAQIPVTQAEEALQALPNARLIRLAGTGHVPMWESPDAFNQALYDFLCEKGATTGIRAETLPPPPAPSWLGTKPAAEPLSQLRQLLSRVFRTAETPERTPPAEEPEIRTGANVEPIIAAPRAQAETSPPGPGQDSSSAGRTGSPGTAGSPHVHRLKGRVPLRRLSDGRASVKGDVASGESFRERPGPAHPR